MKFKASAGPPFHHQPIYFWCVYKCKQGITAALQEPLYLILRLYCSSGFCFIGLKKEGFIQKQPYSETPPKDKLTVVIGYKHFFASTFYMSFRGNAEYLQLDEQMIQGRVQMTFHSLDSYQCKTH